jgi:hypothetical protein
VPSLHLAFKASSSTVMRVTERGSEAAISATPRKALGMVGNMDLFKAKIPPLSLRFLVMAFPCFESLN